ncbi:MAG: hypothetical protein HKN09_10030, partial [Saprospiraceae bacterium]|nr:hypothetical protein [Saprospiraceae bacterium]
MKTINHYLVLIFTLLICTVGFAQKIAVVGISHDSSEGFTFLATQDITAGETVRFTDNEYDAVANVFTFNGAPTGEFVVTWVATANVTKGTVFYVKEVSSNTLTLTCSSGTCGTITLSTNIGVGNQSFSFASAGDSLYAYEDNNDDPRDAIGEIYSVMYTIIGPIPANENPVSDWPNAIVTDGFTFPNNDRTEFAFSTANVRDNRTKADLENTGNYVNGTSAIDMSIVPFNNFNLVGADPVLTVSVSPSSVAENSGAGMVYTFTLDAPAAGAITVNFNVSGSATYSTDYSQSGASTFNATTGTVVIPNAATSASVTLTPVGDANLEPDETAILAVAVGTGYTAGSPSSATGTITNDDSIAVTPVVAITGSVHTIGGTEGFSFVALDDITAGTVVYFTENTFNKNSLSFSGGESVVSWTAPTDLFRGEVIVVTEGPANTFTTTCDSGPCGTVSIISGTFDYASNGETIFAYTDSDSDHTNGITEISAVLFTGTSTTPGGTIPSLEDPSSVYSGAVVVDGFPASAPVRTEYRFALGERGITVDQANFQNTGNWLHAASQATLDTTPFANIIIATGSADPAVTVSLAPGSVLEDSGTGLVYTFTMAAPAGPGGTTVNFTIGGTATFTTDYTQSGADSFDGATGSVTIANGNTTAAVTLTPVADPDVEPQESIELMVASGTGYIGGSPNAATGLIDNDDTSDSNPLVALTGLNEGTTEGFSFVAAQDIPAGTVVYFSENEFDNTTLMFNGGEADLEWTAPAGGVAQGDVIVVTETATNTFSLDCSSGTGVSCGSISIIRNNFALASNGETFYAYADDDNDPTNGVTDIYSVIFTGTSTTSGGTIPATEDPSGIFTQALVIDGFPASSPMKTEYDPTKRGIPVYAADFEDLLNWLHGEPNASGLSTVPFAFIEIVNLECQFADAFAAGANNFIDLAGDGFGPWGLNPDPVDNDAERGLFVGNSTSNGNGDDNSDGDINSAGVAFGFYANNGKFSEASRAFDSAMSNGDIFCIDMDNGFIDNGATVGFGLQNSSDENLIEFFFIGGDPAYSLNDSGGVFSTGIGFSDEGFTIKFTQTAAGVVDVVIIDLGSGVSTEFPGRNLFNPGGGQEISKIRMFNANAGNGSTNDLYFNNIQHCIDTTDQEPPVITCPPDVTLSCGDDTSPANTGTATAIDNKDPNPVISFIDSTVAGCGANEVITRTWTATDANGNSASCDQIISVADTTAPNWDFGCQINTIYTTSGGSTCPADAEISLNVGDEISVNTTWNVAGITVPNLSGCVSDNCTAGGNLIIRVTGKTDDNAGPCQQQLSITFEAEDECGNIAGNFTCTYTIVDDTAPVPQSAPADLTLQCADDIPPP